MQEDLTYGDHSRQRLRQTLTIPGELCSQSVGEIQHDRSKPVTTLLAGHFKLSSKKCPQSPEEEEEMSLVPYASVMGLLMYVMVCTRSDLAYIVSIINRFMSNSEKQH